MPNCKQCNTGFEITDADRKVYAKYGAEPTGFCFECDQKNRLYFRNERNLYKRKCDFSGAEIISLYSTGKPYKVFRNDIWYSDKWDPMEYGRDFDFSRPFFEQFRDLQMQIPRLSLINAEGENSEYCNMGVRNKNSYLVFAGSFNESVLYSTLCMSNRDSIDIDIGHNNELCYMIGDTFECYGCRFAFASQNCKNCSFISDCAGCSECILCTNLSNKSYCIKNKQYSKEEYFGKKAELLNGSYKTQETLFEVLRRLMKNRIVKYAHIVSCQNCSGDYLKNNKNCINCYDVSDSEDVKDTIYTNKVKNCLNVSLVSHYSENLFNSVAVLGSNEVRHSYFVCDSSDIEYSEQMFNDSDCFGCNGIRHKQNCILNKQYRKNEYNALRLRIIKHMQNTGEWNNFFPKYLSCFAYNESTAHQYYPLTKEQALNQGYKWKDDDKRNFLPQDYKVPDKISEVQNDITDIALACNACKINFKITPQELKFYRTNNIPIPRSCPECRHNVRLGLRNPKKLWNRNCQKCGIGFLTTYAPGRPEIVYCEKCYLNEIY